MPHTIRHILGPGGLLSKHLDGYEARPQQVAMAQAVAETFDSDGTLIVEAATGTGKTLAYLIPALLSGQCVVVSTATKALQEQIFHKDVPFLEKLFRRMKPSRSFKAINIKGRTNYLCKLRFEAARETVRLRTRSDIKVFHRITQWALRTRTGDRAEVPGLPDDFAPWSQLTATGQQCLGNDCEHYEDCYVTRVRRQAKEADLIVTNHHLFFADLALRKAGVTPVLPDYEAAVFDEAHHLEETITAHFGVQVSNWHLAELARDVERALLAEGALPSASKKRTDALEDASEAFFSGFQLAEGRYGLAESLRGPRGEDVNERLEALQEELELFREWVGKQDLGDQVERFDERAEVLARDLTFVMKCEGSRFAYIVERRSSGTIVEAAPIDVAEVFAEEVLEVDGPQIYTSATLTAGGRFDYFLERLGMDAGEVQTMGLAPVFDYASHALVYVPARLPVPNHPDWLDGVCQIVEYLVTLNQGRAFVLFTSHRNLNLVHERVAGELPFTVLKQGQGPRGELLEAFREDTHSVLFATSSFWEGVDVEGESLSLVIIDKLPFSNPTDPLVKARTEHVRVQGGHPFMDYSVPQAAISLKQGFGRLIRSRTDRGVVAILDSRICSKRYGRVFLETLPPAKVVYHARDVRDWWATEAPSGE